MTTGQVCTSGITDSPRKSALNHKAAGGVQ